MIPMTSIAVLIATKNGLIAIVERTARCKINFSYSQRGEDKIPEVSVTLDAETGGVEVRLRNRTTKLIDIESIPSWSTDDE
jgi:hypothetical protein